MNTIKRNMQERWSNARLAVFGHLGDNNIHVAVTVGEDTESLYTPISEMIYRSLPENSSVSAEHGIGLHKRDYLGFSRNAEEIALMRVIKNALDPKGILNPGKLFVQ